MKYYSNEIVFRGHPDKVCDQISAAILKECVKQDPYTRAGIEVAGGKGKIFVTGEITTTAKYDTESIVKRVLKDVGYKTDYEVIDNIGKQSADIALGTNDEVGGAGDNGMMFGYACNETEQRLPKAMVILQEFAQAYDELVHRENNVAYLPDGKAQITGVYDDNFRLVEIVSFTICYQNCEVARITTDKQLKDIATQIAKKYGVGIRRFYINPTGKFKIGGFDGDAGLTGRKIVVDAYQSFANVGGGCMNGKDPTKVDFSAAHKAREIAKKYVNEYGLKWCEVQLSYAIGMEKPLAIYIDSDIGTLDADSDLYRECTPKRIIHDLKLKDIDYEELAKFGHFRN